VGVGLARRNPSDRDIPEIGDELAAARRCPSSDTTCCPQPLTTSRPSLTSRRTCRAETRHPPPRTLRRCAAAGRPRTTAHDTKDPR
jgi:hypothetical protein